MKCISSPLPSPLFSSLPFPSPLHQFSAAFHRTGLVSTLIVSFPLGTFLSNPSPSPPLSTLLYSSPWNIVSKSLPLPGALCLVHTMSTAISMHRSTVHYESTCLTRLAGRDAGPSRFGQCCCHSASKFECWWHRHCVEEVTTLSLDALWFCMKQKRGVNHKP